VDSTPYRDLGGTRCGDLDRVSLQVQRVRLKLDLFVSIKNTVVLLATWLGVAVDFKEINTSQEKTAKIGDY